MTKDRAGKIRAFHNVCSHRANMLVLEPAGKANRFICRYHNWGYKNDGDCVSVPDRSNFFDLDLKTRGLTPIACDVWEGWIFINLQKEPEVSLQEFLGKFGEAFRAAPFPEASQSFNINVSNMRANWKVTIDAFCESYHAPVLHSGTVGATFASKLNPFSRPSANARGAHRTLTTFGNPDYRPPEEAAVKRLTYSNVDTGNVLGSELMTNEIKALLNHPAINPNKATN